MKETTTIMFWELKNLLQDYLLGNGDITLDKIEKRVVECFSKGELSDIEYERLSGMIQDFA